MSGLKVFRLLFSLILVLSLPAAFPWFLWLAKDHVPLEIAVVDKTVPTEEYREHRALFWTLKHSKVSKDKSSYQEDKDYVGYHPDTDTGDEILILPTNPDLLYVADTYGVYKKDLEGNPFGERSDLLYGGLNFFDWNRIIEAKGKNTTLIVEFNSIASPTPTLVRNLVEETVGISWSGWVGRYFEHLEGFHYTSPLFQNKVKKLGITQSMSRKGNCWDNAPMESFFGHFKDEVNYKECKSLKELKCVVDTYMQEYNHKRYQWGLNKMTPAQYRSHLLTA